MPLIIRGNILQSRGRIDWLPDGNSTHPSLTFSTDPDTGLYRSSENEISLTAGGTDRLQVNASGTTVSGNANITGHTTLGGVTITGGTTLSGNANITGNITIAGDTDIDGNATVHGQMSTLTLAPTGTAQYVGSCLRLLNNAHPSTRKGISIGSVIRDPDGNNTIFTVDVLNSSNVVTTTPLMYDLNDDRWHMHGITTLTGTLHVRDYDSNVMISSTNMAQYTGPKLIFVNNASQPTRHNTSLGTFVRDSDGTDSYFAIDQLDDTQSYLATMARYDLTDHRWSFLTQNVERLAAEPDGNVTVTGNLNVSGDVVGFASDRRLKTDIQRISGALDTLKRLGGYTYAWRDDVTELPMRGRDMGMIAQEFREAGLDECIAPAPFDRTPDGTSKSGQEYLTIRYDKVHALTIEAIKELDTRLEAISVRLDRLETS